MVPLRSRILKEKELLIGAACAALVIALAILVAPVLIEDLNRVAVEAQMQSVERGLQAELQGLEENAQEIAASETLLRFVEKDDSLGLLSFTTDEARKRGIGFVFIADERGIVLSRTLSSTRRGDYIFETTPYGATVAKGKATTTIESGNAVPLGFLHGRPILGPDREFLGALFLGQVADAAFAKEFKRAYLGVGTEILFIGNKEAPLATSIQDPEHVAVLQTYFGQDWNFEKTVADAEQAGVRLGRDYYTVRFIPVSGIEGPSGRIVVLVPSVYESSAILLSALVAFLFFVVAMAFGCWKPFRRRRTEQEPLIAFCSLIVFSLTFVGLNFFLKRHVVPLIKPGQTIYNSTIAFEPEAGMFNTGTEQPIAIKVTSGGEAINAAQAVVEYDPTQIEVLEVRTEDSFCDPGFFLEKDIDHENGTVTIACGLPNPGYSKTSGVLAKLVVKTLKNERFVLRFDRGKTMVLANDGLGTNVLRAAMDGSYLVIDADARIPSAPNALPVVSLSHPNTERWYPKKEAVFSWPAVEGYEYAYHVDQNPMAIASNDASSTREHVVRLTVPTDGVHYFHLFPQKEGVDLAPTTYRIQIDSTPPATTTIKMHTKEPLVSEIVRFWFSSEDSGSGLQTSYYVRFGEGIFLPVGSQLFVPFLEAGTHRMTVRAFDRANNFSDSTVEVKVSSDSWFRRLLQ